MFVVIQSQSFSSISSVVINVQSKTCDDAIFMDPVSKKSKLTFVKKIVQVIFCHSLQDTFVSNFINSSYS